MTFSDFKELIVKYDKNVESEEGLRNALSLPSVHHLRALLFDLFGLEVELIHRGGQLLARVYPREGWRITIEMNGPPGNVAKHFDTLWSVLKEASH